jgi:hypothetical protein
MIAQVPALIESLSGISVGQFLKNLPRLGPALRAAETSAPAAGRPLPPPDQKPTV